MVVLTTRLDISNPQWRECTPCSIKLMPNTIDSQKNRMAPNGHVAAMPSRRRFMTGVTGLPSCSITNRMCTSAVSGSCHTWISSQLGVREWLSQSGLQVRGSFYS